MKTLDLNIIELKGKEISKLMDYVKSVNFDYEKIIPVPTFLGYEDGNLSSVVFSYRHIIKNSTEDDEGLLNLFLREAGYKIDTQTYLQNIKSFIKNQNSLGFPSAYDFKIYKWGAIHKAKNLKFDKTQFEFYSEYAPQGIIQFLTEKFKVEILHYVADGYESVYSVKNGKSTRIHYIKSYEWK